MVEKKSTKAKSTPKKRTPKKVEVSQPVSEPRQAEPVQPQINWDVIGFSSAAVTLAGAAVFYLIGWSYEVNWHAYYGISMTQVSIPTQQVFIQSISSIVSLVLVFGSTLVIYLLLIGAINSMTKGAANASFDLELFLVISAIFSLSILGGILLDHTKKGIATFDLLDYANTSKIPGELQFIVVFSFIFIALLLIVYLLPIIISLIVMPNSEGLLKVNYPFAKNSRMSFLAILIVMLSVAISADQGIYDAAQGVRLSGGWLVQKIYIAKQGEWVSVLDLQPNLNLANENIYGPFGLVTENDTSYYLVRWKNDDQEFFPRNPGLFIFPRDGIIIIPARDPSLVNVAPSATLTDTPQHTPTLTITPNPTKTEAPTLIPKITLTPAQP